MDFNRPYPLTWRKSSLSGSGDNCVEVVTLPGRWLLDRRIAGTRALLEETDLPVETIAQRVGLSSAVNLRRRFHNALNTTPAAYRRSFR
ncbi:DUF397 domain-containing protein [Streptosporangium sp. NBC_01469]|uniref:DUF397 domain-containing protein n=1 Tax=Streptosporangium sp. NBC_01469 TaxID=2903898 RepID=UPI002E294F25|nr:helix-turn-helix domain-containing protein [Streptosporangium sp. NBC_01469]